MYNSINFIEFYNRYTDTEAFKNAEREMCECRYEYALSLFDGLIKEENFFALTRKGIILMSDYDKDYSKALTLFREAYDKGDPLAGAWICECYYCGNGVKKNKEYSSNLYNDISDKLQILRDLGDTETLYIEGIKNLRDASKEKKAEGFTFLNKAYENGLKRCSVDVADCLYFGKGTSKNEKEAVQLLLNNPAPNDFRAHYMLGSCYIDGDVIEKDYKKAYLHAKKAYSLNSSYAAILLAKCYLYGYGVDKNVDKAIELYRDKVDNNKDYLAAFSLAKLYEEGEEVKRDIIEAVKYYTKSAELGCSEAQIILARIYKDGNGVPKDIPAATKWYFSALKNGVYEALREGEEMEKENSLRRAISEDGEIEEMIKGAQKGHPEEAFFVGGYYIYIKKEYAAGFHWLEIASEKKNIRATMELGVCYLDGIGVKRDSEKGIQLLEKAAKAQLPNAYRELELRYFFGILEYRGQEKYINHELSKKYGDIYRSLTRKKQ